jgi:putative membrane protein
VSTPDDPWFADEARAGVTADVRAIESRTAAEVVVTVRPAADAYREAAMLAGLVPALLVLLVYLYFPVTFTDDLVGPIVLLAFALGLAVGTRSPGLRRRLLTRRRMDAAVRAAAREAFVDQGVAETRGRTGVLVFVALLERRVEVVLDSVVTRAALPPAWPAALAALERSLVAGPDLPAFRRALVGLADPLALALPRQADDTNELPDELPA